MAGFFRCPQHGRFPITEAFPELSPDEAFSRVVDTPEAACPKCGVLCAQCRSCGGDGKPIEFIRPPEPTPTIDPGITQLQLDNWRISKPLHCPDCVLGTRCPICGHDHSRRE